jgi:hypothetical protein
MQSFIQSRKTRTSLSARAKNPTESALINLKCECCSVTSSTVWAWLVM